VGLRTGNRAVSAFGLDFELDVEVPLLSYSGCSVQLYIQFDLM